ncbi:mucin-binding protein [Lactobacillus johnsonii]
MDLVINNTFTIVGINDAAALNLGQKSLNNSGNLTLQDLTINGSISGNGTVNIKGNVTSNVNSINSSVPTQDQYNAQNYTGGRNNFKNSNITGSRVNIENGASLTVNSSEINDGINLSDGGTVNVGDNATLNVNLTNASTNAARYHTAGVFAKNGGNFISGYKSNVNFNTGLGQAISIGATRPTGTDSDRFGGYGDRSRNDGPTLVKLGDSSTFNFTGRDGIILGNNANFISGENSNVHFENKGRGVALDLAANSNIEISKHSTTYFHSVGKTGTSGSYDGYNYIGVNEGGNITVDEYATFRVILEGRGDNPWDDVVSLDSRNANTNAAFTSKTGAIVDIRDDNTNFYAELISFPLGGSNSRIDIHDPLMLNLQRYSNGGATTGWMATGGDMINTTSSQYTANLIYMSGSKGVFSVDGSDYVVYQRIKSDGSKQIWLNVNGVNIPMSGFQTKDIWNNQANPDVSINGNGLTGGIRANQVHNSNGSPLTGTDAPYYGISTQRASHQIWFPHKTQMEIVGTHSNTIKYVDEDGNQLFDNKTQNLNLTRKLTLDITDDKIEEIQNYALSHSADETLEYIKNAQGVSEDSGWIYTDDQGNTITNPYAEVVSPVKDGFTTSIESSNVPGITAGADGTSVTAKLQYKEDLVQNGELSQNYKNNGLSAILPDNYETVVVYKRAQEVKNTLKFYDDTTKSYIITAPDQIVTGKENDDINFENGSTTVSSLENQGYKFVNVTDGTPDNPNATVLPGNSFNEVNFGKVGKDGKTFVVHLVHNQIPVGPDTPNKHGVDPDQVKKTYTSTLHYQDSQGNTLSPDKQQTSTWTRQVTVDAVTNQIINNGQYDTEWSLQDTDSKYNDFMVPVIEGYVARKNTNNGAAVSTVVVGQNKVQENLEDTVVYDKVGKLVPVDPGNNPIPDAPTPSYPNDPTDPTKVKPDQPVPDVPGYTPVDPTPVTPVDPTKDTPIPYTKDATKAGLTVQYIDQDNNNSVIKSDSVDGNMGDKITYTTNSSISDLVNRGYVLVTDGFTGQAGDDFTSENNGKIYQVIFKHGTRPVTPENPADPDKPVDPNNPNTPKPSNPNLSKTDLQKTITRTVEYKYEDGTQAHEPVKQEVTFTGKGTIDLVTGNLVTVDNAGNITSQNGRITWNKDSQNFDAVPAIDHDGYYISGVNKNNSTATVDNQSGAVSSESVTPTSQNSNIVITLTKNPDVPEAAKGTINYIDDTTGQVIESANFAGSVGQKISYTTANSIKNWEAKGYNLVSNNFRDGEEVFTNGNNEFEVHLVHATTPITPDNPGKPGEPVDPSNPDDPHKYPDNYVPQDLTKTVTRDVTYVYADGSQAEEPVHQEVKFTGNGYLDLVTGEYVTVDNSDNITGKGQINWTPENANFDATKSIDTSKYQIIGIRENNTAASVDQTTGVVAAETVTKDSNNSSVVITLANKPTPSVEKGSITVRVHDVTDNVDLPQYGKESGEQEVGTSFTYDKDSVITELTNKGYKIVDRGADIPTEVAQGARTITILVEHDTVPVTPDKPGKPGEPINPNDPDGPKWPDGTDENSVKRTGTQTIHYEGAGDKTPSDDVQTFDFTKKMVVDKVTGKIIDSGEWNVTSHTFGYKDTPVIDGYHADKRNAGGSVVTPDDLNKEIVVTYKPNGKIVPVDPNGNPIPNVPTPTYPTDPTDPTKVVPDEPVPEIPGLIPSTPTVTPEDPGKDTPVPYNPVTPTKDQIAQVIYRDVQDGANTQLATSGNLTGKGGSEINYSTADTIKDLINKGYVLKNDGFPAGVVFDNDDNKTQIFYVDFIHGQAPVNPDNPHEGIDPSQYEKNVKETVHYEGAGDKTPADNVQTSKWTRTLTIDSVTGKIIENGQYTTDWSIAKGEKTVYDQVNTPVVDGYHADKREVSATAVTQDDIEVTVTYKPNGKIVPVDPNGDPIPDVPTPTYPTDPTDPTKVVPDEPVPEIPGLIPSTPTVTPEDPGKDTPVPYTPVTPAKDQAAIVTYVDADNGNSEITNSGNLTGKAGEKINYSTKSTIEDLVNKGYVLVNDGFPADAVYDNDDNTTQRFVVVLKHGTVPVTPDKPGKPGEPINPNDPDGPKWPDGTDENSVKRTGTQTIHYEGAGDKTPSDDVQTFDFTKKMVVDKVTGKIIDSGEWNVTSHTFGYKDTPVIDGYHADKRNAGGTVVTPDDLNKTVTVTYKQNGKIVPVDPNGNPIPDVPTPTYPTDPTDPTKVVPNEPVPEIPGLIPSTPTVTPEDPGKDTPVPYNPVTPAKDQAAIVTYVDADNGNAEITNSGNLTGKAGEKINYSTKSTIEDLVNKGYVLVNDGFPADAAYDNDDSTTQRFVVVLKHGTVPVTPDKPGKPGEPINPNDPDGPKWPDGTDENSVKRTGIQTIHYEGAGDKTPSDDVQTFDFTKKMVVDKVTGKIIDSGEWNVTSHTFGYKDTPVIDGYHADKRNAGGTVVTPEDLNKTVTVTYKSNGKIVPVDPNGNPIPDVPTPTYPTDPTDPTKVVPDEPVPEIPGKTPSTPTVTPEDPGKDTPVPYNPVKDPDKVTTVEGKQIIHFVDGDNNTPLKDPDIQTHEFKITNGVPNESSHTFTLVNVPVIPGYVAEIKSAGGKTVTPDNPLAEVTVVYHKIGKIVPVDPNGNPIPNVPTPNYTNDPKDPTKVVPNEPVPAIPGKTPDKTTITPVDPTKDTPVVYKDNKVPTTPNTQKAVVNFIDVNTGKVIKTSGILSGRPGEDINKLYSSAEFIKQLEDAGYEVVYNAFDGDGVTKYFDNDDNTVQQFTIALKLKEKAKTPDPVLPDPEVPAEPAKDPETPVEKVTRPEQPVKQNVAVPTPEKPVEKKTNNNKEVLPQTGADSNEAATILGAAATAIGMTSLIGAKRRKKDDK